MAEVKIPLEAFTKSEVPGICVFSGQPAKEMFRFRFGKSIGGLPVSAVARIKLARLRVAILFLAVMSLLGLALSVTAKSAALSWSGIALMFVAVALTLVARKQLVQGRVVGNELHLSNVHDVFAHAIDGPPPGKCKTCPSKHECPSAVE